jgi:ABC-type amino acid transport substrate-binding protein
LLTIFSARSYAKKTLVLGVIDYPLINTLLTKIYKEVSKHSEEYNFVLKAIPSMRSLVMTNEGLLDGNAARAKELTGNTFVKLKNIIITNEQIFDLQVYLLAKKNFNQNLIRTNNDLKKFTVALTTGFIIVERYFSEKSKVKVKVTKYSQAIKMLKSERVQLATALVASGIMIRPGKLDNDLKLLPKPISKLTIVPVLNKKYADFVSELERIIKKLREDGTIKKILTESTIQ